MIPSLLLILLLAVAVLIVVVDRLATVRQWVMIVAGSLAGAVALLALYRLAT